MQTGTFIQAGTIVRFVRRGRSRRTYHVRVDRTEQLRSVSDAGNEYTTFAGYRVKPDELNVSFGQWHVYCVRTAEIETVKAAV